MSGKFLQLVGLKECIDRQNAVEAKDLLQNVVIFFDEGLSKAQLEYALEILFHTSSGTIGFLNRTIKERKHFKDSNVIIFDLWIKIIQDYGKSVNFDLYVESILECCMKFIISSLVSAKEKEKSTIVLQEMFQNKLVTTYDTSEIVSKLLEVFNIKNHTEMFLQQVLKLLGIISRDAPDSVVGPNAVLIRDAYIKTIEDILVSQETLKMRSITGAMEGLDLFLINFAPSPEDEPEICQRIYACIKKSSLIPPNTTQKAMFKAALDVFTHHPTLFREQIFKDFQFWSECLSTWITSSIYEERKKGIYGTHSFHTIIAEEIFRSKESGDHRVLHMLKSLIDGFRKVLESSESRPHEMRIAIRGFGLVSGSCKALFSDDLKDILSLVIQRTELISIAEDNELRDILEHFPDYIQALTQMMLQIGDKHVVQILSLNVQNIMVRLIKDFHYLSRTHTALVVTSVCSAFHNLSIIDGNLLEEIMEKIVFQGVVWTCSHKLVYDANLDWDKNINWKDNITYKNYMPFWEGLLDEAVSSSFDKPAIARRVFNYLMTTLLTVLEKLNLRTKRRAFADEDGKDQEFFFCDPNIDLCPEKPKDFHIFFNIVEFYRDIFSSKYRRSNFKEWINEYCSKMMEYAVRNPLVSGFLKLLEVGLQTADYLEHFKDEDALTGMTPLLMEMSYFLKSLIRKCQKMSGELQIACLELILKFPVKFYRDCILDLAPIFACAFDLGKSIIWLAKLGLSSLNRIADNFQDGSNDTKEFYEEVLPYLDNYMRSKGFVAKQGAEIVRYKNRKSIRKAKIEGIGETDLLTVQTRIFEFIGKLDPHSAALIVPKNCQENLVKWDVKETILLRINLLDMKPEIYLDNVVPRICYLAVYSSDRKTKVAACEMVHAFILYLVGTRKHFGPIWRELCSRMLILGADGDATVKEMFDPLLQQVMHYMSKYENLDKGVDVLMEVLMEGISNSVNCTIRDLAAGCIREFVEWGIKQTTPEQLAASPVSIDIILKQLRMYSFDSCASKRSGAALAFNNLYRKLREEESICDIFFMDLLYTFCVNYKLSEEFSSVAAGNLNSDLEQVSQSLDHVVRVLKERNDIFNKPSARRRCPDDFEEGTLKGAVLFLMKETGSKFMNYRRKCFRMVEELAGRITHITSFSMFLSMLTTKDMLLTICVGAEDGTGIRARPTLRHIKKFSTVPHIQIYSWLEHFLSSLDGYCWLLGERALQKPEILFEETVVFETISYYLNNVCWKSLYEVFQQINPDFLNEVSEVVLIAGNEEMNKIAAIKCIISVRMMDFLSEILNAGCAHKIPNDFWSINKRCLVQFITQVMYEPHHLGFDFKSEEVAQQLPKCVQTFLKHLDAKCPDAKFLAELKKDIIKVMITRLQEITESAQEILSSDLISQHRLNSARGIYFSCRNIKLLSPSEFDKKMLKVTAKKLLGDLFYGLKHKVLQKENAVNPPHDVKKFVNKLMSICFALEDLFEAVVNFILDETELATDGVTIKHGEHFFSVYKRTIFEHGNDRFLDHTLNRLFQLINEDNCYYIVKILIALADHMYKYKRSDQKSLETLVNVILKQLSKVLPFFVEPNKDVLFIELMSTLALASPFPVTTFKEKAPVLEEWILFRLRYYKNSLDHKSRIISLLPLIIGPNDVEYEPVARALREISNTHFPLRSKEFSKNSLKETALKSAYKALLSALVNSRSFVILDFIIKSTAPDPEHILEWMIKDELKVFVKNLTETQQMNCLSKIFEIVRKDSFETAIRQAVLERFMLIALQSSNEETLANFYKENIKSILELMDTKYNFATSGYQVEQALMSRIIGYSLTEIMSGQLPKERLVGRECPIGKAMLVELKSGNEFIGTLTKKSFYVRDEVFVTDDKAITELFRVYQCAAYRVVCSLVSNTQTTIDYYNKLIFEEIPEKNKYIWRKLIDCSDDKKYIFPGQEFEKVPRVKERFVSIRKINPFLSTSGQQYITAKYLQTQNIFNSSLSQDVSKIDLNYTNVRNDAEIQAIIQKQSLQVVSVHLERHDLNKHEIMATLCGVIKHMHENKLIRISEDPKVRNANPIVTDIGNSMQNPENHRNVRLFLAQLVDNCREILQHFAHILFRPILEVLVDECAGTELNFFVTDMTALLLSWSSNDRYKPQTPHEHRLVSGLLKNLMKGAWSDKQQIFKFNLELIQTMISLWSNCLSVPYQLLADMITRSQRPDSRENECGIILTAIVLTNDLVPWTESTKVNFIESIFQNLSNDNSAVYQSASQVMGLIMKKLQSLEDTGTLEALKEKLVAKLRSLRNKKEKVFMDILFGVQKNFPEMLSSFKEIISLRIPMAIGAIKRIYLEMFLICLEGYSGNGIYSEIMSIGIKELLKNNEYQLLALHIVNKALIKMDEKDVTNIFPDIAECIVSRKSECRDVAYEIFIFVCLNFGVPLSRNAGSFLLKGLMDEDTQIQNRIFKFWSQEAELPEKTADKIVSLITDYSLNCEKQFLGFCTQLILEPAVQNSDSKRPLFFYENDRDSKLIEYNINTNYRVKSTYTLPPLFVESQQARHSFFLGSQPTNFVRATAGDHHFEPTQDPVRMSQTRTSFTLPTQSSLPFGIQPHILNRRSQKVQSQAREDLDEGMSKSMDKFRNRFLKDKEKEQRERALRVIDYRVRQREQSFTQAKQKEGKVVLYRRYRFGDYPDLYINSLALLQPLQGLVKNDTIIARQIFVLIFNAVLLELGPEEKMFIISVAKKIEETLENAQTCDPTILATFIEIALQKPQNFNFSPETVAMLSKATKLLTIAALYIENRLVADWETERLRTKSSTTISVEDNHWIQLSEIYNALADYDVVASIFSDKLETDPKLSEAIELKANRKYEEATELLTQVIQREYALEADYAYSCYYECILKLGDWEELSKCVQDQIDDVDQLWNDDFNKFVLLPNFVQSEVQLILAGTKSASILLRNLERWTQDPVKEEHIKLAFCEELIKLCMATKNFSQARVFAENYMRNFLAEWGVISSLYSKRRLENLLNAQKVSEISLYVRLMQEQFDRSTIEKLKNQWTNCKINSSENLTLWDNRTSYRTYVAALIINACEGLEVTSSITDLRNSLFEMDLQFYNAAIDQENPGLVDKLLKRLSPLEDSPNQINQIRYEIGKIKRTFLNGQLSKGLNSIDSMEQAWLGTTHFLDSQNLSGFLELKIDALNLLAKVVEGILLASLETDLNPQRKELLMSFATKSSARNFYQKLFDHSLWALKESTDVATLLASDSGFNQKETKVLADAYYRLAQFCYDYQDDEKIKRTERLERTLMHAVLQGMKHGSNEARNLFPCVLQLPSVENGHLQEFFKTLAKEVPEWMFLGWIPQILSHLEYDRPCYLDEVVTRIAKMYPNALTYPFRVWYEHKEITSTQGTLERSRIGEIKELLKNPVVDQFIENFKTLYIPESFLITHLDPLMNHLQKNLTLAQEEFTTQIDKLVKVIFRLEEGIQGSDFKRISKYQKVIENLKILNFNQNRNRILEILRKIKVAVQNSLKDRGRDEQLKYVFLDKLCPWLSQFQWCGEEDFLELPGQYSGNKRPNVQDHIKIVKFGQKLRVFQSQRHPLKLTIYGSNAKTYDFLVKYGDDLQQDQRVQQILGFMSEKLAEDENCRYHNLFIRTYKVIPIEQHGGMLSWVPDTIVLEDFIKNCLERKETSVSSLGTVYKNYLVFLRKASGDATDNFNVYGRAAQTYSIDQLVANFRNLEAGLPPDILRQALLDISVSPESFFVLRNNFATSLAAMSIGHWILGIGDRHLQNILVSLKDGSLTGIDFGYVFDASIRDTAVPEMVPFRLTPQFVNVMRPMGTSGLIFKCITHALRVFRKSEKILMACMEVFVRDPSVNWLNLERKNLFDDESEVSSNWEPKDRIDVARCKLKGYNPMHVVERELKVGYIARSPDYLAGYIKVLHGRPQFNIRARLPENDLTVEEQVKCLIDIATDPGILGITFQGIMPWV